jgi:sigma-E factor negative regulatory protein RseC
MLKENAQVIQVEEGRTVVKTHRGEACHACSAKGACSALGGGKEMTVEVINQIGAREGDRVELALPEGSFLKASAVTYMIPLLGFLLGAILGQVLGPRWGWDTDAVSVVLALAGLGLSGILVAVLNRRLSVKEAYIPRIVRVLPSQPDGDVETGIGAEAACS